MNKIAIALLLGGVFAVGCGDKGADGGKSGSAAASGSGAKGPAVSKVCEEYLAKMKACNEASLKDIPDGDAKTQMKKGFDDSEKTIRDSWKGVEGAALDDGCKKSMEAMVAANPKCPK